MYVYTTVAAPSTRIDAGYDHPVMTESGIAVANRRTLSPRARVSMKIADEVRRALLPQRVPSTW